MLEPDPSRQGVVRNLKEKITITEIKGFERQWKMCGSIRTLSWNKIESCCTSDKKKIITKEVI